MNLLRWLSIATFCLAFIFATIYAFLAYRQGVYDGSLSTPNSLRSFEIVITFFAFLALLTSFSQPKASSKDKLLARIISLMILLPILGYIVFFFVAFGY